MSKAWYLVGMNVWGGMGKRWRASSLRSGISEFASLIPTLSTADLARKQTSERLAS
jgi:hypothetical protein